MVPVKKMKQKMMNHMKKNKSWILKLPNSAPIILKIAPLNRRGNCFKCQLKTPIRVISKHIFETRLFCWDCSLWNLEALKDWEREIENKEIIIKELSTTLAETIVSKKIEERLECHA